MDIPLESTRSGSMRSSGKSEKEKQSDPVRAEVEVELAASVGIDPETVVAGPPGASDPLAEAPNAVWYVRSSAGGQFGPANREVMATWIAEGRVSPDSLVWRKGWRDWREAASVFPQLGGPNYVPGMQDILPQEPLEYRPMTASYSAASKGKSGAKVGLIVAGATTGLLIVVAFLLWLFH